MTATTAQGGAHPDEEKRDDASGADAAKGEAGRAGAPKRSRLRGWPWILAGLVVLSFIGAVLVLILAPGADVRTDDAFVTAHYATIAPRIAGQVVSVNVNDNREVRAGDLLATIDDRDYQTTVATAHAVLEHDQADLSEAQAALRRQPALIRQAEAQTPSATAQLIFAQANRVRYTGLADNGAGSQQESQQAEAQARQAGAAVEQARASADAAQREIPLLEARIAGARSTVKADEARLRQAELNLSYTRLTAPIDGYIGQRLVQVGNIVAAGAPLMVVTPLNDVYIEANYREVALRHVLPGQPVSIHVDAYNLTLRGVVDSVPPASGAAFGAIQPNNATGNFTKIVQRLPVKIVVSPGQNETKLLRLGFSVETTIHTALTDVMARQHGAAARVTAR